MRKAQITKEQLVALLNAAQTEKKPVEWVAQALKVSRRTVENYINRYEIKREWK